MKCLFFFSLIFLGCISQIQAEDPIQLEVKIAAFHPNSPTFRKIYHDFQAMYSFELAAAFASDLYGWFSSSYMLTKGDSLGESYPTSLQYVPLGAGLYYKIRGKKIDGYLGAGMLAGYVNVKNHSPYINSPSEWSAGGIFKVKCLVKLPASFFLDVFADYSIMQFHFNSARSATISSQTGDLSGFSFGLGVGYQFGSEL